MSSTIPVVTGEAEPPRHPDSHKWVFVTFISVMMIASLILTVLSFLRADAASSGEQAAVQQAVHSALAQQAGVYGGTLRELSDRVTKVESRQHNPQEAQLSATLARLGFCYSTLIDSATGDLSLINIVPPVVSSGVYSCGIAGGTFVSVAPTPGR